MKKVTLIRAIVFSFCFIVFASMGAKAQNTSTHWNFTFVGYNNTTGTATIFSTNPQPTVVVNGVGTITNWTTTNYSPWSGSGPYSSTSIDYVGTIFDADGVEYTVTVSLIAFNHNNPQWQIFNVNAETLVP